MAPSPTSLELGRAHYAARSWQAAVDQLTQADDDGGLSGPDLERLAVATALTGRAPTAVEILTRAHKRFLDDGDVISAARCAGWIGMHLMLLGERATSGGWFARAQRLVQEAPTPCSVEGLLLIPAGLGAMYGGDPGNAAAMFGRAEQIGEEFHDPDVTGLSRLGLGHAQIMLGRSDEGLRLLDEAMVAVTAGEISPIPSGIIYCGVIDACHLAFDVHRAQEWTTALDRWCQAQPDLVPFSGQCRARRAELYVMHGAWSEALEAARIAQERLRLGDRDALFGAHYQQGEVERLRGDLDAAEQSYRRANESGYDPQPGLALLRLARGNARSAQSLIRRAAGDADPATRRRRLPAQVEIELAAGDVAAARACAEELTAVSRSSPMPIVRAVACQADGTVLLAEGDPADALRQLRRAWALWMDLDAPYEAARCRIASGRACHALGDDDSAAMEFEAARAVLLELGAGPELAALEAMSADRSAPVGSGLTPREVDIVRHVSTGMTNRQIAHQLFVSEKTVARHLSNIFTKLGLASRAAVTAYAYEHGLV